MTTVNRADRKLWAAARSLADVGHLTACWLEGVIASQPGYHGPSDIEDPAFVPLLAKLNRAGFVTTGSQAGESGSARGGGAYEQRAAVEGYASLRVAAPLIRAAGAAGLIVVTCSPAEVPRWRYGYGPSVTVTRVDGRHFTEFGVRIPRRHIRDPHIGHGVCSREAVKALCSAWQVTLIDPEFGREGLLWDVLDGALHQREVRS